MLSDASLFRFFLLHMLPLNKRVKRESAHLTAAQAVLRLASCLGTAQAGCLSACIE